MTRDELKSEIASMPRDQLERLAFMACATADSASIERDRLRFELEHTTEELAAEMVRAIYHEGYWQ